MLTEDEITISLADYLDQLVSFRRIDCFSHVSNETFTKSWAVKHRNKAKGVRKGTPDFIIVKDKRVLFLELKREKGGVLSPEQKVWIASIGEADNLKAVVAKGLDQALKEIKEFFSA